MFFDILDNFPEKFTFTDYIKLIPAIPILVLYAIGMIIVLTADTVIGALYKDD
jgi:hypothetical protein